MGRLTNDREACGESMQAALFSSRSQSEAPGLRRQPINASLRHNPPIIVGLAWTTLIALNNHSIEEMANFLCRTSSEIEQRKHDIAEVDSIGDPSLLRNGLTDRVALEAYRDGRAAMALIRETVEDCAPLASVQREGFLPADFTAEAEALVRGSYAIAARRDV